MLILIAIVFIIIGSFIMGSIYSIFSPFIENIKNITDYNVAYYGAISGAERAELTLKYHGPGFEGSGGYIGSTNQRGPNADQKENFSGAEFGKLTKSSNGFYRNIKSRTSGKIPEEGKGNIDLELQTSSDTEAKNYNKLEPNMSEEIGLGFDNTSNLSLFYKGGYETTRDVKGIDFYFRLNPLTKDKFENLNIGQDADADKFGDDGIIGRSFAGTYENVGNKTPFSIQPYITNNDKDTRIRESNINNSIGKITFKGGQNPFDQSTINSGQNTIPSRISETVTLTGKTFYDIFNMDGNIKGINMKFSLLNILKSTNGNIYPFIEYKIDTGVATIPDRFFHITGVGKVGQYEVFVKIEKPSFRTTTNSDFVIYF